MIIKEYLKFRGTLNVYGLRSEKCPDNMKYLMKYLTGLFEGARKDFPDLKMQEVLVKHYGDGKGQGTYGIEFYWKGEIPDGYELDFSHFEIPKNR